MSAAMLMVSVSCVNYILSRLFFCMVCLMLVPFGNWGDRNLLHVDLVPCKEVVVQKLLSLIQWQGCSSAVVLLALPQLAVVEQMELLFLHNILAFLGC